MKLSIASGVVAAMLLASTGTLAAEHGPRYTSDGSLVAPSDYREWIYLSSGIDMSYRERMDMGHSMFDNVFAAPEAYREFVKTGTWPDQTVLVMEVRGATSKGSINVTGKFQTAELMGMEAHVKDTARFAGGWGFFAFDGDKPAAQLPTTAACYSCHQQHAAVDTTFVQFYPTLLGIATTRGTLSESYRHESAGLEAPKTP